MNDKAREDAAEVRRWIARLAHESREAKAMLADFGIEAPPDRRVRFVDASPRSERRDGSSARRWRAGMSESMSALESLIQEV